MIFQISPVQNKTQALSHLNKGLIQARHIQARLKEAAYQAPVMESSRNSVSSLLPANSWFD